ncbi:MAG TPA: hypothetical protein VI076_14295, partial [Actinopolymorphaceae bacterium]
MNGGAWLDLGDQRVAWILRDLDRVREETERARRGEFTLGHQAGHPFGFPSLTCPGEVALGIVAADPAGELRALRAELGEYPEALR